MKSGRDAAGGRASAPHSLAESAKKIIPTKISGRGMEIALAAL